MLLSANRTQYDLLPNHTSGVGGELLESLLKGALPTAGSSFLKQARSQLQMQSLSGFVDLSELRALFAVPVTTKKQTQVTEELGESKQIVI